MKPSRRDFLRSAAVVGASSLAPVSLLFSENKSPRTAVGARPLVISSANGLAATAKAMELIRTGADALDAVVAGVNIVENDPNDMSVGYGGIPNEDGDVELDASVMHGPSGRGAGVASIRNIKNPSSVAKVLLERSDHVLLVGPGALRFAKAHGFKEEDLLTNEAREVWLQWKENLSRDDDWLPPHSINDKDVGSRITKAIRHYGTINCNAIDQAGNISGVTTTSGLSFKIAGRVGDSPILGAGLYVDNEVGAAGSTGRGEANLLSCSSVMIVEFMRQGKSPEQACLMAGERIVRQTKERRLLDEKGRPNFNVNFYAINKKGEFGGASIFSGAQFAINTGETASRLVDCAFLYKRAQEGQ